MATNDFESDAIRNIQTYLRHLSFHSDEINDVPIDGIWDSETSRAVAAFQKQQGLPVTGTVDRDTWDVLKKEYDLSVARNSPPVALALFPRYPENFVIRSGDTGYLVDTVQFLIDQLERLYGFTPARSGVFDKETVEAVRDFQKRNNISVTGDVDRETWDAMAIQHNLLLGYGE